MILPKMTDKEILSELNKDFHVIKSQYLNRYCRTYDKIRRKNPRLKREELPKSYSFETQSINKWILILSKPPADNKYNGIDSISVCLLCYYYTEIGIRVFKVDPTSGIGAFNGHFFARYNERLNLGLTNPVDKVIHYFSYNSYCMEKLSPNENGMSVIGKCRDGYRLGDYIEDDYWIVYKTFISNDLSSEEQNELGESLMTILQKFIEEELSNEEFDRNSYFYQADLFKGIMNSKNTA